MGAIFPRRKGVGRRTEEDLSGIPTSITLSQAFFNLRMVGSFPFHGLTKGDYKLTEIIKRKFAREFNSLSCSP